MSRSWRASTAGLLRGQTRLVLGHESLGRVVDPGPTGGLKKGDLVAGIVRRPDPVPCPNCAVGEWDMCRNGQYTERGIKQIHGFMSERWRIEPEYGVKVDRSLGLARRASRARDGRREGVGAGRRGRPTCLLGAADRAGDGGRADGLLAALLGMQRGLEIHVLDRAESGPKPEMVRDLGATYHSGSVTNVGFEPDVIVECTGVGQVIADSIQAIGAGGVVCLTGVGSGGPRPAHHGRRGGRSGPSQQRRLSAASTPTSGTGTRPGKPWREPIDPGSPAWSHDASGRRTSQAPWSGSQTTSRSSSSSPSRRT